jgi:hypothetical protein
MELVLNSNFSHKIMKSLDYVPISPKTTIPIANGINLTFNIYCNLVIIMDTSMSIIV